jgi:hypothetical protein
MLTKICSKCKLEKSKSEFHATSKSTYCKTCHNASARESREKNRQGNINEWLDVPEHECRRCKAVKPNEEFYWKSNRSYCKECTAAMNLSWAQRNKERVDNYRAAWRREQRKKVPGYFRGYERRQTLKKFGLPLEWYEKTYAKQKGVCAICGKPETSKHQNGEIVSLSIDHDHATGKARGLLCRLCNHHLHSVEHNVYWPFQAVAYLSKFK